MSKKLTASEHDFVVVVECLLAAHGSSSAVRHPLTWFEFSAWLTGPPAQQDYWWTHVQQNLDATGVHRLQGRGRGVQSGVVRLARLPLSIEENPLSRIDMAAVAAERMMSWADADALLKNVRRAQQDRTVPEAGRELLKTAEVQIMLEMLGL